MATYGQAGQPSQNTINYDALLSTSLFNYRKTLVDNISDGSPFFYDAKPSMEGFDGGVAVQQDLMYELGNVDTYDGYDELSTAPNEGITASFWDWRQASAPISISGKERKQNKHRLISLVESKLKQAELGLVDFFNKKFLQGSYGQAGGSIITPYTSPTNGSNFLDPIAKLIAYDPTTSVAIGNINQNTYSWWRNRTKTSSASTYQAFLLEMHNMYNTCSIGPGGPPTRIYCDQTTYELWNAAYYQVYRRMANSDNNYPFENIRFKRAIVTWDPNIPNVAAGTNDTTTANGGTAFFVNWEFLKIGYESETNFVNLPFERPINQDAEVAHILWMGAVLISNRRKLGVVGNIARSLS